MKIVADKIPVAALAQALTLAIGAEISEDMIKSDLAAGMPCNHDGTVNMVKYAAWLMMKQTTRDANR
jgi:hypothetical protein